MQTPISEACPEPPTLENEYSPKRAKNIHVARKPSPDYPILLKFFGDLFARGFQVRRQASGERSACVSAGHWLLSNFKVLTILMNHSVVPSNLVVRDEILCRYLYRRKPWTWP